MYYLPKYSTASILGMSSLPLGANQDFKFSEGYGFATEMAQDLYKERGV